MTDNDPTLSLAHTMVSSPGLFALLLGSGVSRSSGIPTGWEITLGLVRDLATLQGQDPGPDPAAWFRAQTGSEPDYSALLERLARATGERRNLLERFFEPTAEEREEGLKRPTEAHRVAARLMAKGYVRVVLTTNFDRLLEESLAEEGIAPVVISSEDDALNAEPLVHQRHVIIKLHGDYKDPRIMNTSAELETYGLGMDRLLAQVLDDFGLVVCGWSGEWDTALRAGFARVGRARYSAFWASLSPPSGRGAEVADGRGAETITIRGADEFFGRLEEMVLSLEDLRAQRPSSPAIAVATLKRYLAEDRFRIRLEDLVREEAVSAAKQVPLIIDRAYGIQEAPPVTLSRLDQLAATLRAIYFHGCRLATAPNKEEVFVRCLEMMFPRERAKIFTPHASVQHLRPYLCGTVLLAGAYGALANENWGLLRKLLTLPFVVEGETFPAYIVVGGWRLIPDRLLPTDAKVRLPEATHLKSVIMPLAEDHVPDPEDLFHRLELWTRLARFERPLEPNESLSMAIGCYMARDGTTEVRQPETLFLEADKALETWSPLTAGWFRGRVDVFKDTRTRYGEWAGQMRGVLYREGLL